MTAMVEGDLRIGVPSGASWRKADDPAEHGLTHCMSSVDFIVETTDRLFFVECKDFEYPTAPSGNRRKDLEKMLSGAIDDTLKVKYRDSFLYEWASGRATKPAYYLVLIALSALSDADLLRRTEALKRRLPVSGPGNRPWPRPFVCGCAVMNIEAWNRKFPEFPVARRSG